MTFISWEHITATSNMCETIKLRQEKKKTATHTHTHTLSKTDSSRYHFGSTWIELNWIDLSLSHSQPFKQYEDRNTLPAHKFGNLCTLDGQKRNLRACTQKRCSLPIFHILKNAPHKINFDLHILPIVAGVCVRAPECQCHHHIPMKFYTDKHDMTTRTNDGKRKRKTTKQVRIKTKIKSKQQQPQQ